MRAALVSLVLSLALVPLAGRADGKPDPSRWDGRSLVAHEWGTFTTVQGSDGVVLEGLRHEERDLPDFVHDLRDYTGVTGVSPKMETPVVYFYAPTERKVRVRVDFPRGAITQWYPSAFRVNHMGGMTNGMPRRPDGRVIDTLTGGFIEWGSWSDLTILAPGAGGELPTVSDDDPWRFCRQVGANTLRACSLNLARKEQGPRPERIAYEHERCLFYRGLGDFPLPLRAQVESEHVDAARYSVRLQVENLRPAEPIEHLFLVWVGEGRCGWFYAPSMPERKRIHVSLDLAPVADATETLVRALAEKLTRTGLFADEALAMARTWQRGYFRDPGLRALYVLPRAFVDRELPLRVEHVGRPKDESPPFEVVRTFVGRVELLSPSRETAMSDVVRDFARGDDAARARAAAALDAWGRFAIPYLHRVAALAEDGAVREAAHERLAALALRR